MKKLLSMLLCLVMLAAMSVSALAATGDVIINAEEQEIEGLEVSSFCAIGDVLYMLNYDRSALFTHRAGDSAPVKYTISQQKEDEYGQSTTSRLLTDGEQLMVLDVTSESVEGQGETARASLYQLRIEGQEAQLQLLREVDWSFMKDEGTTYYNYAESICSLPGCALITSYDSQGNRVTYRLDYESGQGRKLDLGPVVGMCAYTDGKALIELFDYNNPKELTFATYDPASDAMETISTLPVEEYRYFTGIACDLETGKTYCTQGGEIFPFDVTTGELGEAVAAMPLDVYSNSTGVILKGGFYAWANYNTYALRNVNPDQKAQYRLKISDTTYSRAVNAAYYAFSNSHGDVSVVVDREGNNANLVENMMNRDASVDIYIISASSKEYEAVHGRGYMADFSASESLNELAQQMPATLREQLSVDGKLAVLPVEHYFWLLYVDEIALEELGMKVGDIPTNWSDFLDFLLRLQENFPQGGKVTLFDPYTSDKSARRSLFDQIFKAYQQQLSIDPHSVNVQMMVEMLHKLDQIDFTRLGQPTEEEVQREDFNPTYREHGYLISLNMGKTLEGICRYESIPVPMGLTAQMPVVVPMEASVAFINPYSEHPDLALEFIENMLKELPESVLYCLRSDLNEPTMNPYHDEQVKYAEEYVEQVSEQLKTAEPVDRQRLEEELSNAQKNLENVKADIYAISPEDIEWLRAHQDELRIAGSEWLYQEGNGDAYELVQQYLDGKIDANRLMQEIDGKIRMMLMEGY